MPSPKAASTDRVTRSPAAASAGARRPRPRRRIPSRAWRFRSADEARAAVREHVEHGVDWIKLFPTAAYSFDPTGKPQYVLTYPKPVLEAAIEEAHRLGRKTGCHVLGGEGEHNAILSGCDTIEHAFGLTQEEADMMVAKGLAY